jgi:hypothetical protein
MSVPGSPLPGVAPQKIAWLRWVLLGCAGLLVLGGLIGGGLYFIVQKATAGPEKVVQEFLAAAAAGDYPKAHDYFSAPLQEVQPLEAFAAEAAANQSFFRVTDTKFTERSVDMNGAQFSGTVTLEAGTELPASFKLVREKGAWKLLAYHLGSS